MQVVITIAIIFLVLFIMFFLFIYNGEKKELEMKIADIFPVIIAAFALALIPTAVIALIIFVLIGSTNVVNFLFSLNISMNKLIIMALSLCAYLLIIDGIVETVLKLIVGENIFQLMILLLIHIFAFYIIGLLVGLSQLNSFIIALGVALIIFTFEILYDKMEKSKE